MAPDSDPAFLKRQGGQSETGAKTKAKNNIIPDISQKKKSVADSEKMTQEQKCNSASSQRARILNYLRTKGSMTTLQARHYLDVMHPAARCQELRHKGHPIETTWIDDVTPEGNLHRVGKYILAKSPQLSLFDVPGVERKQGGEE